MYKYDIYTFCFVCAITRKILNEFYRVRGRLLVILGERSRS